MSGRERSPSCSFMDSVSSRYLADVWNGTALGPNVSSSFFASQRRVQSPMTKSSIFSLLSLSLFLFIQTPVFHVCNTDFSFFRNLAKIRGKGSFLQLSVICIFVVVKLTKVYHPVIRLSVHHHHSSNKI